MNFTSYSPDFYPLFKQILDTSNKVVITSHISPDDDSVSSVLSTFEIVSTLYPNKDVRVIYSSDSQPEYSCFKNYDQINFVTDVSEHLSDVDTLIMLDGSQYSRFSKKPEKLSAVKNTICIDHHASPIDEFSLVMVDSNFPANSELIFQIFSEHIEINKELAEVFLFGILGDTGNFTFLKPTHTDTFIVAKKLIEISGVEVQEFLSRYRSISSRVFEVIQKIVSNTSHKLVGEWPGIQYSYITEDFVKQGSYTDSEISDGCGIYCGMFLRKIGGYPWGFVITPKSDGNCSISCRSLPGSVAVKDLMENMGIGGGHQRAAGGSFKNKKAEESVELIMNYLQNNSPLIG